MKDAGYKTPGQLTRLIRWIQGQWVREIPSELALCEFDCRKDQCLEGEWSNCERRLTHAAGELMPEPPAKLKNLEP
jgi:hypothetical protein